VYVANAVFMLPKEEFEYLANAALDRSSFVVQLAGVQSLVAGIELWVAVCMALSKLQCALHL